MFVGIGNYTINPFNMFDVQRIEGLNTYKPEAPKRIRTYKKYQPFYSEPNVLIVGNSRVEMGLSPKNYSLKQLGKVYNLGIPGMRFLEQVKYVNNILESQRIDHIIVGIDFSDYIFRYDEIPPIYRNETKLKQSKALDFFAALWSLDALNATAITLFDQTELSSTRDDNGFNPARDYIEIIKHEGQEVLLRQKAAELDVIFKDKFWVTEMADINIDFKQSQNILKPISEWKEKGIEVYVFINPYQKLYYDKLKEHHLYAPFLQWKSMITRKLKSNVKFCDFTAFGHQHSERKLSNGNYKYFWEPSHYKKEFGDMLIPKILKGCAQLPKSI